MIDSIVLYFFGEMSFISFLVTLGKRRVLVVRVGLKPEARCEEREATSFFLVFFYFMFEKDEGSDSLGWRGLLSLQSKKFEYFIFDKRIDVSLPLIVDNLQINCR